jgi:hypothetical protein
VSERERERERAKLVYLVVAFSLLQCCQSAKQGKGERDFVFFFLRFRVDSPKSVRIHAKKFTSACIHFIKCVPICWRTWLGQGILCVQASRLASLPPASQSGPSGKAKCHHHSLTKNGNVRNLTNGHISCLGHPRAILKRPTSCQSARRTASSVGERERAKPAFFFFLRLRVDKSVRIHSKKLTSVRIHLTKMCANLLAELVGPRDLVCAGFTAGLTASSPPVWSKQKSSVIHLQTSRCPYRAFGRH